MRSINQIQADISKLQAELADVKELDSMNREAVHILKNLGWTRQKGNWVKPPHGAAGSKLNIKDYVAPQTGCYKHGFKMGDVVKRQGYFGRWVVRQVVSGTHIYVSEILQTNPFGGALKINKDRYLVDVMTLARAFQ